VCACVFYKYCIQLIIHWLLKQVYHKVHCRTVTTLRLRCRHQLHHSEALGILFSKPTFCKYSPNDPCRLYKCSNVPHYSTIVAPSTMTRTHRSLIGFRQNRLLRITNKLFFPRCLELPALPRDRDEHFEK
jgi:hypothetical protein